MHFECVGLSGDPVGQLFEIFREELLVDGKAEQGDTFPAGVLDPIVGFAELPEIRCSLDSRIGKGFVKEDEVTLRIDDSRDVKVRVSKNFIASVVSRKEDGGE